MSFSYQQVEHRLKFYLGDCLFLVLFYLVKTPWGMFECINNCVRVTYKIRGTCFNSYKHVRKLVCTLDMISNRSTYGGECDY